MMLDLDRAEAKKNPGGAITDDYRRSMVVAILNAAEITGARTDAHCQTRITGELLSALAPSLKKSKLIDSITSGAGLEGLSDNVPTRVDNAAATANKIFEGVSNDSKSWNNSELYRIYRTFYDALYQRTPQQDAAGHTTYLHNEHILQRDAQGNLVRNYDAEGKLLRPAVLVYYQAEFQIIEHTFTQLLRKRLEEQKNLLDLSHDLEP